MPADKHDPSDEDGGFNAGHHTLGPRRNQATSGMHRHKGGSIKDGYLSQTLFEGQAPVDLDELIEILEDYGLDGSAFTGGGGGGGSHDHFRDTFDVDTTSLPDGDETTENPVVPAAGMRLYKLTADAGCRIRLYPTSALAAADLSRPVGTDVDIAIDHGLLLEFVTDDAITYHLSPAVDIHVQNPATLELWANVKNRSGVEQVINVTFYYVPTEWEA